MGVTLVACESAGQPRTFIAASHAHKVTRSSNAPLWYLLIFLHALSITDIGFPQPIRAIHSHSGTGDATNAGARRLAKSPRGVHGGG